MSMTSPSGTTSKTTATATKPTVTTTTMLCGKCGGAIAPPRDFQGRVCTCTSAATSDSATTTAGHKFCCACGADVTHARRMKDHSGRYWCYECGAADQMKKGQAIAIVCHDCQRSVPPKLVMKVHEHYVCTDCLEKRKTKGKRGGAGSSSGLVLGIVLSIVIVIAAVFALRYVGLLAF